MKGNELAETERRWRKRSLFRDRRSRLWRKSLWTVLAIVMLALIAYAWIQVNGDPLKDWVG